jgi:hypothetical protein
MKKYIRPWPVALAAAGMELAGAAPAIASRSADPAPIGPDQFFVGLVNGQTVASRIAVTCDGPIDIVPTGHPVAGQTLEVRQVVAAQGQAVSPGGVLGFTGTAAHAVDVRLGSAVPDGRPAVLSQYGSPVRIPTNVLVPCDGTRTVLFEPATASPTAKAAAVTVTFVTP